jgi:phospholipid/cholesterol/gamma-HCH transport system substrate-binding protein
MTDRFPALKFGVFAVICLVCAAWLIQVTGNIRFFASTNSYEAVLDDVTGLVDRDSVLLAGVRVGTVEDIEVERGKAVVRFSVDEDVRMLDSWEVGIRWRNVIGQRFFYLYPVGGGEELPPGGRLPEGQARATADIGRFFERLTPLLRAIDPEQQNKLLIALNEALDGKEERIQEMVSDLGALSSDLADREGSIRTVIGQGASLLEAYAARDDEIRAFLDDFADVSRTVRERNDVVVGAVRDVGEVQSRLDDLLRENDAEIRAMVDDLASITSNIGEHREDFEKAIGTLNDGFATYMLVSRWGQWFNIRAVAVQVQDEGRIIYCQSEDGTACSVPSMRAGGEGSSSSTSSASSVSRAPARYDGMEALVGGALGSSRGDGMRRAMSGGGTP